MVITAARFIYFDLFDWSNRNNLEFQKLIIFFLLGIYTYKYRAMRFENDEYFTISKSMKVRPP